MFQGTVEEVQQKKGRAEQKGEWQEGMKPQRRGGWIVEEKIYVVTRCSKGGEVEH